MQRKLSLKLRPAEAINNVIVEQSIAKACGVTDKSITGYHILKKSIDARSRNVWVNLTLNAFINEPFLDRPTITFHFKNVEHAKHQVVIVGAGPAGLFAALKLIEQGIRPIILERGKDVKSRRRDLAVLNKEGIINPESNYCFGEGGAGTYSDGKLYTRSTKRGDINRILQLFYYFGATENILYENHPHIGTNKLPQIITTIRQHILDCGGIFLFNKKVTDFTIECDAISYAHTSDGDRFKADAFILATGHSAKDIFKLLYFKKINIEPKPFALGVRVEHPQELIDSIQYHSTPRDTCLPPASYNLVEQVNNKGVFSFCMCPGGIIAPAATNYEELVVNGWSPSKRNNPYANSGIVVQVNEMDAFNFLKSTKSEHLSSDNYPLLLADFQSAIERAAYIAGGGKFIAPAQRMVDFVNGKISNTLPNCSYLPGVLSTDLKQVLPSFVHQSLQIAFKKFGKKMYSSISKSYFTNEAIIVAVESRTSSPVRIPRNENLHHPQIANLYPCGEGAGYAGGIVSAAMDGERVATVIVNKLNSTN